MADFTGRSDVSHLTMSGPAANVPTFSVNTDQFKVMPEIMNRAFHQQEQLKRSRMYEQAYEEPARRPVYEAPPPRQAEPDYGVLRQNMQPAASQAAALQPYYVKRGGVGPNQIMGNRPAQPWEPGAVFAGYLPAGYSAPQPQQARVDVDPRREALGSPAGLSRSFPVASAYEGGAEKPTLTSPGGAVVYETGNPYATGPGVVGGRFQGLGYTSDTRPS